MLSRTADHLYWMSRYTERAENLARLLEASYRTSLLPRSAESMQRSLRSMLRSLYLEEAFLERHPVIEARAVFAFIALERDHPGSIFSCLRSARENARAVRGTLTSELWVTLNSTWLDARALTARGPSGTDIGYFVDWVKERAHLTRGVMIGTMIRDESFYFTRIGTFIERADSTARILRVHQRDLEPGADADAVPDPYEWTVLLRALSAFEVYRRIYRDAVRPLKVAHLLILREDVPRSLLRCCREVYQNLRSVANESSAETERRAGELQASLAFKRMEDIAVDGLPRFLERVNGALRDLGERIASDFLVPPAEP